MAQARQREVRAPAQSSGAGSSGEMAGLRKTVSELEDELDALHDALCCQALGLVDGYIVTVYPTGSGSYIAACPTLHASVEQATEDAAMASLREAMSAVEDAFCANGIEIPARDTERQWGD